MKVESKTDSQAKQIKNDNNNNVWVKAGIPLSTRSDKYSNKSIAVYERHVCAATNQSKNVPIDHDISTGKVDVKQFINDMESTLDKEMREIDKLDKEITNTNWKIIQSIKKE